MARKFEEGYRTQVYGSFGQKPEFLELTYLGNCKSDN